MSKNKWKTVLIVEGDHEIEIHGIYRVPFDDDVKIKALIHLTHHKTGRFDYFDNSSVFSLYPLDTPADKTYIEGVVSNFAYCKPSHHAKLEREMKTNLVSVEITRDQIQFEDFGGEHSTGRETRESANFWADAAQCHLENLGYTADVTAGCGNNHHRCDFCITVGNLVIPANCRGPLFPALLTPAQLRMAKEVIFDLNAADEAAYETLHRREEEIVAEQRND